MLLCPGPLGDTRGGKLGWPITREGYDHVEIFALDFLVVALMLIYGTATAKGYRWSCTFSDKVSPAGIETEANLQLDFIFDDVTRKAMVLGNNGSGVDVHIYVQMSAFGGKADMTLCIANVCF